MVAYLLIALSMVGQTSPTVQLDAMAAHMAAPFPSDETDATDSPPASAVLIDVTMPPSEVATNTYYVSPTGSDANNGLTRNHPFKSIQKAADVTNPGDTVLIMAGTYTAIHAADDVLKIDRSGQPGRWITFRNDAGSRPLLFNERSWQGINISGASYIVIDGLEVRGNNKKLTRELAEALDDKDPTTNGNCIMAHRNGDINPHHLIIRNNIVHNCPGGGIGTTYADYVSIRANTVFNTSWWSKWGNSGISIYESRDFDNAGRYKNLIIDNIVCGNEQRLNKDGDQTITDGNGIIVDDLNNTQSSWIPYNGRTLISNNIVYLNGGRGIHIYHSRNVDVRDNTLYWNNTILAQGAEISVVFSDNVNVSNNAAHPRAGQLPIYQYGNGDKVHFSGNRLYERDAEIPGVHGLFQRQWFGDSSWGEFRLNLRFPPVDSGGERAVSDGRGALRPGSGAHEGLAAPDRAALGDRAPCHANEGHR